MVSSLGGNKEENVKLRVGRRQREESAKLGCGRVCKKEYRKNK